MSTTSGEAPMSIQEPVKRQRRRRCPRCGELGAVPVIYGLPSGDLFERAERGEVILGGCFMGDDPDYLCHDCA